KKDKSKELRQISRSLHIHQPFYPYSEFVRRDMDTFVWEHLSLQMQCSDDQSHLVHRASLAGAHLTLMFPLVEEDLSWNPGGDDHAERHVTKFCLLRFAALLEDIIEPLRNLNSPNSGQENALNVIAAAGVLYCELEYVNQSFQARKLRLLCVDPDLEKSLRAWLKIVAQELLSRLQNTCGTFPLWAEQLLPPRRGAKRNFGIQSISIAIEGGSTPSSNADTSQQDSVDPGFTSSTTSSAATVSSATSTPDSEKYQVAIQSQVLYGYQDTPVDQIHGSQSPVGYSMNINHPSSSSYDAVDMSPARSVLPSAIEEDHDGHQNETFVDQVWTSRFHNENNVLQQGYTSHDSQYHFAPSNQKFATMSYHDLPISSTAETSLGSSQPFHVSGYSPDEKPPPTSGEMAFGYDWTQNLPGSGTNQHVTWPQS
ncbi:hypothetical protein DL98DRAFT_625792, partial [Cadophora sp. DSE1049]